MEGEGLEQERRVAPEAGIARLDELDRVLAVARRQGSGIIDRGREAVPPDRPLDRGEPVAAVSPGRDQLRPGLREQPQGPVDHAPILAQARELPPLGAAEHAADELVVRVERRVGQARPELEQGRHQDPAPAYGGEAAQVAEREPLALPRQADQVVTRDAGGALDLDPDLANPPQALDGGVEGGGAGGPRRLPEPPEPRPGGVGTGVEQPVEACDPPTVETFGQPREDRPLAPGEGRGAEPLDGRDRRHDDLAAPQLVAKADGQLAARSGREGGALEPSLDLPPGVPFERAIAEGILQGGGVLVPGVRAERVAPERVRRDADLLGDKGDQGAGERFAGVQQPPRVSKGAELQGEPEPVPRVAAALDHRELGLGEGVVPRELGPVGRQGQQGLPLGGGQEGPSRHGVL